MDNELILKKSENFKFKFDDFKINATIKTNEKPKENNINGDKLIFLLSSNWFKDLPDTKEIYPGTNGKTHGDKKLIIPAPKAMNNSIIKDSNY